MWKPKVWLTKWWNLLVVLPVCTIVAILACLFLYIFNLDFPVDEEER